MTEKKPPKDAADVLEAGGVLVPTFEPTGDEQQPQPTEARQELKLPDIAAICAGIPGSHQRVRSYCAPLDAITGGGLQTGKLVIVGGPPGVTKTGWVLATVVEMATRGRETRNGTKPVLVYYVAGDEPRSGIYSRVAQMRGTTRAALDDEDTAVSGPAWDAAARALLAIGDRFVVWDPSEDEGTVERFAVHGQERAKEMGASFVLAVDSLQTAPFDADIDTVGLSPRERMDGRINALKKLRRGTCVIAISELNRGAYAGPAPEAGLGSFKESSSIEYGADLAMTMRRLKEPEGVIEVTPQKNRLGDVDPFLLRRLPDCTFEPVDASSEDDAFEARESAEEKRVRELADEMQLALAKKWAHGITIGNRDQALELVKGRQALKVKALALLKNEGRITADYRISHTHAGGGERADAA